MPTKRTSPRKNPVQSRSKATVEAILVAAGRTLVEHGYETMSTNLVAQIAGVSVGSLYQYFPSKDALVAALIDEHVDRMTKSLRTKLSEIASRPPSVVIRTMVTAVVEAHAREPQLHRALMEQVPRVGSAEKLFLVEREMEALVSALLSVRRSDLRRERVEAAAFIVVNALEAATHTALFDERPRIALDVLIDELTDMVSRYLLP